MTLNKLEQIELEFEILIQKDRRNWLRVAKLLDQIESQHLYKLRSRSFTEYVKNLALKNRINISTLWRARSGAKLYLEILDLDHLDQLDESVVKTTPEQLETFSKVRTIAPNKIVEDVKEKMIRGENMRHELRELWQIYRPLKGGKTERGRKKEEPLQIADKRNKSQFALPYQLKDTVKNENIQKDTVDSYWKDLKKMEKYQLSSENLARANILNALRSEQWIARTLGIDFCSNHEHLVTFEIQIPTKVIDLLTIAKPEKIYKKRPIFIGSEIITELEDFKKNRNKILNKHTFCDYFYLAIPMNTEYITKAEQFCENTNIGIICVGDHLANDTKHICKVQKLSTLDESTSNHEYIMMQKIIDRLLGWSQA